jgi:hypothetical protein
MALLFRPYPTISYRVPGTKRNIPVTDITRRFSLVNFLKNSRVNFDEYHVQDGETPQGVAYDYYGDVTLDWLVLFSNEIQDPYFDWPLSEENFKSYVEQKYGSLQAAFQTVHHYEWIIQKHQVINDQGTQRILPEKKLIVDYAKYVTLIADERKQVSTYEHELELNEAKRMIYLIDLNYTQLFIEQHPFIFDTTEGSFLR